MPSTAEESIPELLARLEREHPKRASRLTDPRFGHFCGKCIVTWPCDIARLVAHIRSLEQTLGASSRICPHSFRHAECAACNYQAGWRAALGEAQ
jgi:hypothetical protein